MDQGTLSIFSAIGGVVAAFGGLFAALAACLSARTANNAADRVEKIERRSLLREVTSAAQIVIGEALWVNDLADKLNGEYQDLFIFAGATGGGSYRVKVEKVEERRNSVIPLQQEAKDYLLKSKTSGAMSEEELSRLVTKIEGNLIQIRRIKEQLEMEKASVGEEIRPYREKAIKDPSWQETR